MGKNCSQLVGSDFGHQEGFTKTNPFGGGNSNLMQMYYVRLILERSSPLYNCVWFGFVILLMEEILRHLRCIKPCKYWEKLPTSTGAFFFKNQQYRPPKFNSSPWFAGSKARLSGVSPSRLVNFCTWNTRGGESSGFLKDCERVQNQVPPKTGYRIKLFFFAKKFSKQSFF